jgi:hypothetical protein
MQSLNEQGDAIGRLIALWLEEVGSSILVASYIGVLPSCPFEQASCMFSIFF